jgi:hypothetical protein
MVSCKLCIRRLTLALGALSHVQSEDASSEIDEEANRIIAREQLHRALEISVDSSLSQ